MNNFFRKRGRVSIQKEIDPEDIFMDSQNLPGFDKDQFEGQIEKPISKNTILFLGLVFILMGFVFVGKVWNLQVANGLEYAKQSEENLIRQKVIFSDRGTIYDIVGNPLAWNETDSEQEFSVRKYESGLGLSNLLGYVSYPKKDSAGFYFDTDIKGVDGIENIYNDLISGENGLQIIEVNALNDVVKEGITRKPQHGKDITLTIDSDVQKHFSDSIINIINQSGFAGGGGVIMDVFNGDILALASYPDYDSNILSDGNNKDEIAEYVQDANNPFLNRIVDGLYTPGSIVKPFMGIAALTEGVITPNQEILSVKNLVIPNPYNPDNPSIFTDWKAHGYVDIKRALAMSSNVYFYQVGGGYEDLEGLGIARIEEYMRKFGFGEPITTLEFDGPAGTIPNPKWKQEIFDDIWRLGDTYFTSIGQYGFQVTPLQVVRAVSAIANEGTLIEPRILADATASVNIKRQIDIPNKNFEIIKEGMREVVLSGTGKGLSYPDFEIAAKTGTAELGVSKARVNSWVTGFFPYDNPRYAFVIVLEKGERSNLIGGVAAARGFFDWLKFNKSEYIR